MAKTFKLQRCFRRCNHPLTFKCQYCDIVACSKRLRPYQSGLRKTADETGLSLGEGKEKMVTSWLFCITQIITCQIFPRWDWFELLILNTRTLSLHYAYPTSTTPPPPTPFPSSMPTRILFLASPNFSRTSFGDMNFSVPPCLLEIDYVTFEKNYWSFVVTREETDAHHLLFLLLRSLRWEIQFNVSQLIHFHLTFVGSSSFTLNSVSWCCTFFFFPLWCQCL